MGPGDMPGFQPHRGAGGHQLVARRIVAHRSQQHRLQPKPRQPHGDVHRHAAGQPGDPPWHIVAERHLAVAAADDVPQHGADTENVPVHAFLWQGGQGVAIASDRR